MRLASDTILGHCLFSDTLSSAFYILSPSAGDPFGDDDGMGLV